MFTMMQMLNWTMKDCYAVAGIALLLALSTFFGCERPKEVQVPEIPKRAPMIVQAPEKTVGKALFNANCISCHGQQGEGLICPATNLRSKILPPEKIKEAIQFGRPSKGMMAYSSQFTAEEIDSLVKYVKTLQPMN
jgi:mono/diheme cytochrome c family protein